jgi:hypothetical protein
MNRYEVRIVGHLDRDRFRALGASGPRLLADGSSAFVVSATDSAALYGLLARLRDAAIELVAVRRLPQVSADDGIAERGDPS